MPSPFETLFSTSRALLLAGHGTPNVPYAAGDTPAVNVTAIVGAVAEETIQIDDTRTLYRHRPVSISTSDVPNPVRGDRLTIDGEAWTVHERLPQDGGMARLTVVRPVRAEAGGRSLGR